MIHKNSKEQHTRGAGCIIAKMLLAVVLVCGLAGPLTQKAEAASWMDPYLQKVVDWGVMRGDIHGNLDPNRDITRAEFVSMVNRAYGYDQIGKAPFKDIKPKNWYYEDICIGWNTGYFAGTSPTTASPLMPLSREQAAVLIGHNMMLQQDTGEALGFSDSRQCADWSRHMVQAMSKEGIISGSPNGNFYPKKNVTRGEVAVMLVKAIGTPIQEPGVKSLGGVYGNVTITSPGVTLKNTTIYGDLYITGGVGLSNVVLENVKVTGKIVVSGTGESEKGEHSVILRNVTADELVLDSLKSHFVTLKAEGLTDIKTVNARTGTFLEDVTNDGLGLKNIVLDGERGTTYNLAGNIKEVLVKSPASVVSMGQGVANVITVDETAVGTNLKISDKATVNTVNLDTAASVTGTGDIGHMNVNAAGSSSTILPDTITVRPGVTINVQGEVMDSVAAQESSADPRLLAGYPMAKNVSPKTAEVAFKTNKSGTIYWAVTALNDGTVGEEELINPPVYSGKILKSGSTAATASNKEFVEKISGLTTDGSYYISAILVDKRGMRSPVKIDAFTTPDDTVPAFANGYPYAVMTDDDNDEQIIQAMVMPNKNCQMYYALMAKGSSAPKPADFKANAVTGNLGYGVVELQKNTPFLIAQVNSVHLKEETDYDLYLWLTDADGTKSSAVKKLTVRTLDRTPPKIQHITRTDVSAKSVTLSYALSEPGTLYWAVVKSGAPFYLDGVQDISPEGMAQVESGINAIKKGSSTASKGMTDVKFNISGLEPQTAYDVYYMAKDKAGNYCIYDKTVIDLPYTVYTLDNQPPTVKQEFTHDGTSGGKVSPYPDTSIRLVFSENIRGMKDRDQDGKPDPDIFLDCYANYKKGNITDEKWVEMMREYFKLYVEGETKPAKDRVDDLDTDWVIDYRKVKFELDPSGTGELIMTFPYNSDSALSAVNLSGGTTYHFELEGLADTSDAANRMEGHRGITKLPNFTTISAQIMLTKSPTSGQKVHMPFNVKPISNQAMPSNLLYDLIVWSDKAITFKVHQYDGTQWGEMSKDAEAHITYANGDWVGVSLSNVFKNGQYDPLKDLSDTTLGIEITSINGDPNPDNWNQPITLQITAVSGDQVSLPEMSKRLGSGVTYEELMGAMPQISDITTPMSFSITYTFLDTTAPKFETNYPTFAPGDSGVKMRISLDRPNSSFYYVVAPLDEISTTLENGGYLDKDTWKTLPESGQDANVFATTPTSNRIMTFNSGGMIKAGFGRYDSSVATVQVTGLQPKTKYVAYFVLKGEAQASYSPLVYCFRFETGDVATPIISLLDSSPQVGVKTSTDADVDWILIASNMVNTQAILNAPFYNYIGVNEHDLDGVDLAKKQKEFEDKVLQFFPELKDENDPHLQVKVIDALSASIGNDASMSVFDRYAGKMIYDQVLTVIRQSAGTSYLTARGNLETEADNYKYVAPEGMTGVTQYYFIAAARHTMGTQYGFKAVPNIHMVNADPPDVVTVITQLDTAKDSGGQKVNIEDVVDSPGKYTYSGKVSVSFTKPPYHVYRDEKTGKYITTKLTDSTLKNLIGGNVKNATVAGQTIEIEFENVKAGSSFLFFKDGWIGDVYGNMQTKLLRLTFKAPFVNPDKELPEFIWEWN